MSLAAFPVRLTRAKLFTLPICSQIRRASRMSKRRFDALESASDIQRPNRMRKMAAQPVTTTIDLTDKEAQLKDFLLGTAKYINKSQPKDESLVLRFAGGWVRDKLLGIESHDIDIAINIMTGQEFAVKMLEYSDLPGTAKKHSLTSRDVGSLHTIPKNPDKSKHLETATVNLLGFGVDFVNLRKESYSEDSRNPQMEFGEPEEDALRRDATINALFYNLNTSNVEDFTSGLADMKSKFIKTPLEPFQTFMDDPLRVLRLVRFASRLGFTIDPAAEKAMGDSRVMDALKLKISRERVGVEIEKMLKGKDPRRSLQYVNELGLYHTIFTDPTKASMPSPDLSQWPRAYECLEYLSKNKTSGSIYDILVQSDEDSHYAWTMTALIPWENVNESANAAKSKRALPLITMAGREGIKTPNKLCDLVTAAHTNRENIMTLKKAVLQKDQNDDRVRFGMSIRSWSAKVGNWKIQVLFCLLVEATERWGLEAASSASNAEFLNEWKQFLDYLQELDVMDAPSLARIIDGTQLAKALGVKPGRWMTNALDVCVAWQLRNPGVTDPAGAIEEVRSKSEELGIPSS